MRVNRKSGTVLGTAGVVAVGGVVAAVLLATGTVGFGRAAADPVAAPTVGFSPSSGVGASAALQTGQTFLADWQRGDLAAAAALTDDPGAALNGLGAYRADLKLSGLTLLPNTVGASGWLTFSVTAQVGSPASAWSYTSGLAAYQGSVGGVPRWFVKWNPDLLFTSLKAGQHLALGSTPATASQVDDSSGRVITAANAPSLANIVSSVEKDASGARSGAPGQSVQIENSAGAVVATAATVSQPVSAGAVRTTIDLTVQTAAQAAADRAPNSSVVVVQPSTGNILAVANNPSSGIDTAMIGALAPGSTFKPITTTLLLDRNLLTNLGARVQCPRVLEADGIALHNSEDEEGMDNSFLQDFAQSCNNAFSSYYQQVTTEEVAQTAQKYYGFNEPWDVGLNQPTTYGNVPDAAADSVAEELVGQDRITTSPLAMASAAATIDTGTFKQPILIPGSKQLTATPLPAADDADLHTLMQAVVTQGTLASVIDVGGAYAKTGTAEVGTSNNSWTIAFKGDYAICALAVDGGFGAAVAGPEANAVLHAVAP